MKHSNRAEYSDSFLFVSWFSTHWKTICFNTPASNIHQINVVFKLNSFTTSPCIFTYKKWKLSTHMIKKLMTSQRIRFTLILAELRSEPYEVLQFTDPHICIFRNPRSSFRIFEIKSKRCVTTISANFIFCFANLIFSFASLNSPNMARKERHVQ